MADGFDGSTVVICLWLLPSHQAPFLALNAFHVPCLSVLHCC